MSGYRVPVNCFTCGASMQVLMSRVRKYKRFFCGSECRNLCPPAEMDERVERIRLAVQEDRSKVIEYYTTMLNRIAGSHGLTQGERDVQHLCRERFGLYDPDDSDQICFVTEIFLATTDKVEMPVERIEESANDKLWGSYLSSWTGNPAVEKVVEPKEPIVEDQLWAAFLDQAA